MMERLHGLLDVLSFQAAPKPLLQVVSQSQNVTPKGSNDMTSV